MSERGLDHGEIDVREGAVGPSDNAVDEREQSYFFFLLNDVSMIEHPE